MHNSRLDLGGGGKSLSCYVQGKMCRNVTWGIMSFCPGPERTCMCFQTNFHLELHIPIKWMIVGDCLWLRQNCRVKQTEKEIIFLIKWCYRISQFKLQLPFLYPSWIGFTSLKEQTMKSCWTGSHKSASPDRFETH